MYQPPSIILSKIDVLASTFVFSWVVSIVGVALNLNRFEECWLFSTIFVLSFLEDMNGGEDVNRGEEANVEDTNEARALMQGRTRIFFIFRTQM